MITSDRMAAVDRNAEAVGVPRKQLMESSGNALAEVVGAETPEGGRVEIVAGRGNNGGDAFVAARFLDDYDVTIRLLGRPETITTDIARENWDALEKGEYDARTVTDSSDLELDAPDTVVDAMLGTGITGALREPERTGAETINAADATVVSVDVPSGMDADTGDTQGVSVAADRVVTFHDSKPGLEGHDNVAVADIGIPEAAERFVGPGDLLRLGRDPTAHKGDFGRVVVVGGGPYTGAPALASIAALRAGADLVFCCVPEAVADEVQGYSPDLIVDSYGGERFRPARVDDALETIDAYDPDTVLLGPGLGDAEETLEAARELLTRYEGDVVVDADALQVVPDTLPREGETLCTPHQGELVAMGGPRSDDHEERAELVAAFAAELGVTVLVKGAYDVISDGKRTRLNRTGNPGMTVGGTGDVLAGATAALASTLDDFEAAAIAAYANGSAGDMAVEENGYGLLASDLPDRLPKAMWE